MNTLTTPIETHALVYDVAHDLQTPLTALKAHLGLIERRRNIEPKIKVCHEIVDSMSAMVSDMLAYARAEAGIDAQRFVPFDLSARVLQTLDYVTTVAEPCGVNVSTCIQPGIVVRGLSDKLDDAFLNLVSNSLKYLGPERRSLSISLTKDADVCVLVVADTGIGIPADELPRVFTRFYRTSLATKHAPGTGLGLAIVKKVIDLHGGTIMIESEEGKGTRVEVKLPIAKR